MHPQRPRSHAINGSRRARSERALRLYPNACVGIGSTTCKPEDGLWRIVLADGNIAYRTPGCDEPIRLVDPMKEVREVQYVSGRWNPPLTVGPAVLSVCKSKLGRRQPFIRALLSKHFKYSWEPAFCDANQYYRLAENGIVEIASDKSYLPVGVPNTLPSMQTLLLTAGRLEVHDSDGRVVTRYRYNHSLARWERLVLAKRISRFPLGDVHIDCEGTLEFVDEEHQQRILIRACDTFVVFTSALSGLCRPAPDHPIAVWDGDAINYFIVSADGSVWQLTDPEDAYHYSRIECGIGLELDSETEPIPGLLLQAKGIVIVNSRAFMPGELIDICVGQAKVKRRAGYFEELCVSTPTLCCKFVYGHDLQWWRGCPRSPCAPLIDATRSLATDSIFAFVGHWIHVNGRAAPGSRFFDHVIGVLFRNAQAISSTMSWLPFSPIAYGLLLLLAGVLYTVRSIIGLPYEFVSRAYRHCVRALKLWSESAQMNS